MAQLSRPYQIALGALLVLALAWFTVLKPSDGAASVEPLPGEAAAAPVAPGQAGLTSAVNGAKGAAAASAANAASATAAAAASTGENGGAAVTGAPAGGTAAAVATGATGAKGPAAAADPSKPILRDVAAGKVAVVLFFNSDAYDDRAVRRALSRTDRHGGRVVVHAAPISRVADYAAITDGVDVVQAPTLLVVGRGNRARQIVGFTDTRGIDQLVSDVGGADFTARRFTGYRGRIENLCTVVGQSLAGNLLNATDVASALEIMRGDLADARSDARKLEAPRKFFAFQRAFERGLDLALKGFDETIAAEKRAAGSGLPVLTGYAERFAAADRRTDRAAKKAGISTDC